MSTEHPDVAAELWALAETVLTRLEPVLRQAAADQQERPRQGCTWCPVCALAALIRGEQHDLLTLIANEGGTVLALIRQLMAEHTGRPTDTATAPTPSGTGHTDADTVAPDTDDAVVRRAKFEPITVTVKDSTTPDR